MLEEDVGIIALHETHATSFENLCQKGAIAGFSLAGQPRVVTHERTSLVDFQVIHVDDRNSIHIPR